MSFFIDILFGCFVLFCLAGLGRRILSFLKFSFESELQAFTLGLSLGSILLMFGTLILGFFGLIQKVPLVVLVAIFCSIGTWDCLFWIRRIYNFPIFDWTFVQSKFLQVVIIVGLITVVANMFRVNTPPVTDDELSYHLYGPKYYAKTGYWKPPPVNHYPNYYPQTPEMLYTIGMLFHRDITPAIIHFMFGLASLLPIYLIAKRITDSSSAVMACVIFYTMPRFTSLTHIAYTDFILLYLSLSAVECYFQWRETKAHRWILLGELLLSAALASKFSMLSIILCYSLFVIYDLLTDSISYRESCSVLLFWFVCGVIFFLPWFIRNHIYTGNIFYPFSFFGLQGDEIFNRLLQSSQGNFLGKLKEIVYLPHRILTFDFSQGSGPLVLLFPLIFAVKAPISSTTFRILLFCFLQILLSVFLLHAAAHFRYILISHALLSILSGAAIGSLLCNMRVMPKRILKFLVLAPLLVPNLAFAVGGALKRMPYSLGQVSREEYLNRFYGQEGYDTVTFVNRSLPQNAKILVVYGDCARPYYYDADLVFCNSIDVMNSLGYGQIKSFLEDSRITHILFIHAFGWQKGIDHIWELHDLFRLAWLKDGQDQGTLIPIYDNGKAIVYEINND